MKAVEFYKSLDKHTRYFVILIFLAFFQFPIIWIGQGVEADSIGLYDLFLVFFTIWSMTRRYGKGDKEPMLPRRWQEFFVVAAVYACFLFTRMRPFKSVVSILQVLKFIENMLLLFNIVLFLEQKKDNMPQIIKIFTFMFFLLGFAQFCYALAGQIGGIGGIIHTYYGNWYRLGLPFMQGVSSNPAGFVLGSIIIFYSEVVFKDKQSRVKKALYLFIIVVVLILTISKTNIMGLIIVYAVKVVVTRKNRAKILIGGAILVPVTLLVINAIAQYGETAGLMRLLFGLLTDPIGALQYRSFEARYQYIWPNAIALWLENVPSFLFGRGLYFQRVVDGTVPRLLSHQGLVGFVLFSFVWVIFFFWQFGKYRSIRYLMLFVMINSINGETLVVSYRATQAYLVVLAALVYVEEYYNRISQAQNHMELGETQNQLVRSH